VVRYAAVSDARFCEAYKTTRYDGAREGTYVEFDSGDSGVNASDDLLGYGSSVDVVRVEAVAELRDARGDLARSTW
jgi:hypothetical protein